MRMHTIEGVLVIDGDEVLLAKIEGEDLSGIDVSDLPVDADTLSKQFLVAQCTPGQTYDYHETKRYAVLKQLYMDKVNTIRVNEEAQ
jgi:hypothetical protein